MSYESIQTQLDARGLVGIDGAIGIELERRGVPMNHDAWSAVASIEQPEVLEQIHVDYIRAGARIVTANTLSSSRLMLTAAGFGDRVVDVNRAASEVVLKARETAGVTGVAVAGSLSHRMEGYPDM